MDGDRTLLRVELESDSEPIAGRIREPGGRVHEFAGYMSLIGALERLRRPPGPSPSTSPPPEGTAQRPERRGPPGGIATRLRSRRRRPRPDPSSRRSMPRSDIPGGGLSPGAYCAARIRAT